MCLAVPGKIAALDESGDDPIAGRIATVDFQGSQVKVSLAMTPDAGEGDWVLVHAGFAITVLDEAEARETWQYLELAEIGQTPPELKRGEAKADTEQ